MSHIVANLQIVGMESKLVGFRKTTHCNCLAYVYDTQIKNPRSRGLHQKHQLNGQKHHHHCEVACWKAERLAIWKNTIKSNTERRVVGTGERELKATWVFAWEGEWVSSEVGQKHILTHSGLITTSSATLFKIQASAQPSGSSTSAVWHFFCFH